MQTECLAGSCGSPWRRSENSAAASGQLGSCHRARLGPADLLCAEQSRRRSCRGHSGAQRVARPSSLERFHWALRRRLEFECCAVSPVQLGTAPVAPGAAVVATVAATTPTMTVTTRCLKQRRATATARPAGGHKARLGANCPRRLGRGSRCRGQGARSLLSREATSKGADRPTPGRLDDELASRAGRNKQAQSGWVAVQISIILQVLRWPVKQSLAGMPTGQLTASHGPTGASAPSGPELRPDRAESRRVVF